MITIINIAGKRVQTEHNYIPGLLRVHDRAERRKLDGIKPTPKRDCPGQPRKYKKMFRVTPMESDRVMREITKRLMPDKMKSYPAISKLIGKI